MGRRSVESRTESGVHVRIHGIAIPISTGNGT
jgi:hypothetical protein